MILGIALLTAFPLAGAEEEIVPMLLGDEVSPMLVEVQPNPPVNESAANETANETDPEPEPEWVEFANPTPRPLSLEGFFLTDYDGCFAPGEGFVDDYRWPLNATVPAEDRLVVELPTHHCLTLANSGDTLALEDEEGRVIQNVTYGSEGELAAPEDGDSLSACHAQDNLHRAWEVAAESRNATNPECPPILPTQE